ncbi:MAG: hypothetical protein ABRQ27_04265 [Clostridiaceae bacterium]
MEKFVLFVAVRKYQEKVNLMTSKDKYENPEERHLLTYVLPKA